MRVILFAMAFIGFLTMWAAPVIYHWCIKPNKSLKDGLRDWMDESADDF